MLEVTTATALKAGIAIRLADPAQATARIRLSAGNTELILAEYPHYSHPAFIPMLPWLSPTPCEAEMLLTANIDDEYSQTINIVRIPDEVLDKLRSLITAAEVAKGIDGVQHSQIISQPDYEIALDTVRQYVVDNYAIEPDLDCRGLIRCNIGLATSTINTAEFLPATPFAGLHLDSWDYLPFRQRHLARNRICINLGCEERYFLLINRTLQQMFTDLELHDPEDIYQDYRGVRLANKFLQAFPNYPVVRLAIYPGEAYIAPTENFIHDATSEGKTLPDWSVTFLGRFLPSQ